MTTKTDEQENAELLPCPFCGGGTTEVRDNGRPWLGSRYGDPVSVSVRHLCDHVDSQPSRMIERVGRDRESAIDAWNRRAVLQSQVSDTGWKEAAIAWEVCASLHRQYCKGKDPLFTTRQGDFVRHATESRHRALRAEALQSQEYTAAIGGAGQAYLDRFKNAHALPAEFRWSELWAVMCVAANKGRTDATQSQDREDALIEAMLEACSEWSQYVEVDSAPRTLREHVQLAIDHARRIEGK